MTSDNLTTGVLFQSLLHDLWGDLGSPGVILQALVLAACLLVGWWASRRIVWRWQQEQAVGPDLVAAGIVVADVQASAIHATAAQPGLGPAAVGPAGPRALRLLRSLQTREAVARLLFPLYSLGLLLLSEPLLSIWQRTHLLRLAMVMLVAAVLVRLVVFAVSTLARSPLLVAFERFLVALIWTSVALKVTGYSRVVIDLLSSIELPIGKQTLTLWTILSSSFWVILTVLVAIWLGGVIDGRLLSSPGLDTSLRAVLSRVIRAVLLVVAVLLGFSMVGIDLTALSVLGGALGVGIGLGLQRIAANYISGFVVLLERKVRLGDVVRIDSVQGKVRDIRTRYTLIEAGNGALHVMPNELLITATVQNLTITGRMRLTLPVQVAYDTDLDQAVRLAVEAASVTPRVLAAPAPAVVLTRFDPDGINLELSFSIGDPNAGQGNVISEVARELWRRYQQAGIRVPGPRREVTVTHAEPSANPAGTPAGQEA